MRYHWDGRRALWGDIFELPIGDINVVQLNPRVVIAWHRHRHQDDRIKLIYGDVFVQAIDLEGVRHTWYMDSPHSTVIFIPRGWWHGYSSQHGATLVQFNGPKKWDGSDEERMSLDETPWLITPTP